MYTMLYVYTEHDSAVPQDALSSSSSERCLRRLANDIENTAVSIVDIRLATDVNGRGRSDVTERCA